MFEYISGDLAADLVNAGDQLSSYDRLLEWARGAGAITAATADRLGKVASTRPADAMAAVESAHRLIGIVLHAYTVVVSHKPFDPSELNAELARVMPRRQLEGDHWAWRDMDRELDSPLWPVVLAAANLLASPDAARLRVCADADCGWLFVDRSRNGLRRWCSMADCGTKAKTRRRAAKQSASVARRAP